MTPEEYDKMIVENADIIERLANCTLSMVKRNTGEVFDIKDKRLVKTGKFVNLPRRSVSENPSK